MGIKIEELHPMYLNDTKKNAIEVESPVDENKIYKRGYNAFQHKMRINQIIQNFFEMELNDWISSEENNSKARQKKSTAHLKAKNRLIESFQRFISTY